MSEFLHLADSEAVRTFRRRVEMLRHLRPIQPVWRFRRLMRSALPRAVRGLRFPSTVPEVCLDSSSDLLRALPYTRPAVPPARHASQIAQGVFTFLGTKRCWPNAVPWDAPDLPRLWRFHLHYFDYALDLALAARGGGQYAALYCVTLRKLQDSWMDECHPGKGDAWHPYTTSVRLVNWIRAHVLLHRTQRSKDEAHRDRLLRSLFVQARAVHADPERDVPGNHLVRNARALLFAGRFFEGEEPYRWEGKGKKLLVQVLDEQVLEDGGHFERSPYYHAQVLGDLIDVFPLLEGEIRRRVESAIRSMRIWLGCIRHADGTLPLFNDGAVRPEASISGLLQGAAELVGDDDPDTLRRGSNAEEGSDSKWFESFPASGYWILKGQNGDRLIVDGGPPAPKYLPAHAHCDLLALELSLMGQRVLANAGTFTYEPGDARSSFRGTAAHNTVQVIGEEQSDIWGSFRMGRRAQLLWAGVRTDRVRTCFHGAFCGFRGNRIRHERQIVQGPGPAWAVVDTLRGPPEEVIRVVARYRLVPETTIQEVDGPLVRARRGQVPLWLRAVGGTTWNVRDGWMSPDMGRRDRCKVLALSARGVGGVRLACVLGKGTIVPDVVAETCLGPPNLDNSAWQLRLRRAGELNDFRPLLFK